mmetsp:Transcript_11365/g.24566  ORF Transcript_11365/g.24566 Transcript_11365/m.24566 type:complete len:168 (-) Transcript_11365:421-924(-)
MRCAATSSKAAPPAPPGRGSLPLASVANTNAGYRTCRPKSLRYVAKQAVNLPQLDETSLRVPQYVRAARQELVPCCLVAEVQHEGHVILSSLVSHVRRHAVGQAAVLHLLLIQQGKPAAAKEDGDAISRSACTLLESAAQTNRGQCGSKTVVEVFNLLQSDDICIQI